MHKFGVPKELEHRLGDFFLGPVGVEEDATGKPVRVVRLATTIRNNWLAGIFPSWKYGEKYLMEKLLPGRRLTH